MLIWLFCCRGPAYVPSGITGRVSLIQSTVGKLDAVIVKQAVKSMADDKSSASVDIEVIAHVQGFTEGSLVEAQVFVDDVLRLTKRGGEIPSCGFVSLGTFNMAAAKLWWPRGHGEQALYKVEVRYYAVNDKATGPPPPSPPGGIQSMVKFIGVRTVELVQEPFAKEVKGKNTASKSPNPAPFYFLVNGEPVYMRGANMIPLDSFEARVSRGDRQYLMAAAAEANYNTIRVWGGGYYQPDDLYDLADRLGLMMWQEIMLAVSDVTSAWKFPPPRCFCYGSYDLDFFAVLLLPFVVRFVPERSRVLVRGAHGGAAASGTPAVTSLSGGVGRQQRERGGAGLVRAISQQQGSLRCRLRQALRGYCVPGHHLHRRCARGRKRGHTQSPLTCVGGQLAIQRSHLLRALRQDLGLGIHCHRWRRAFLRLRVRL